MSTEKLGLRERKSARMRDAIEQAAAELTLEQGFANTTVEQIAARADVAPRTVFARYPTKDAIIFSDALATEDLLHAWIDNPERDLLDGMSDFVHGLFTADPDRLELKRLRAKAMLSDPYLRSLLHGRLRDIETRITARVARELHLPPDDAGLKVIAAAFSGLFLTMTETTVIKTDKFDPISDCAHGIAFIRAGLDALRSICDGGRPRASAKSS